MRYEIRPKKDVMEPYISSGFSDLEKAKQAAKALSEQYLTDVDVLQIVVSYRIESVEHWEPVK